MRKQPTFSDIEYEQSKSRRRTRRAEFLEKMDAALPWDLLKAAVEPRYFHNRVGRPPVGLEKMLRMYFFQRMYNLSDEACEDELYDSASAREFVGVGVCEVPDATTLEDFRHLLEDNDLGGRLLGMVNKRLAERGLMMRGGTIVDATFIDAPASTKNKDGRRDPEAASGRKGANYHFGYKVGIGVDAGSGNVHAVAVTPANKADVEQTSRLIRKSDRVVKGDAGFLGAQKRDEIAKNRRLRGKRWDISARPGKARKLDKVLNWAEVGEERRKAVWRSKVEMPFQTLKCLFGFRKTRYRGLRKLATCVKATFALVNVARLVFAGRLGVAGGSLP